MSTLHVPRVGVGVLIIKDGKILLGKRKNAHGAGTWAPCGGHLELYESFEQCAQREAYEETGLKLTKVRYYGLTNNIYLEEQKHYLTVFMMVDDFEGEPQNCEPDKCEGWAWFAVNELPENLFLPFKALLKELPLTSL